MNRGSTIVSRVVVRLVAASMRPRFMNRGSADDTGSVSVARIGFNEAPIHESGKFRSAR